MSESRAILGLALLYAFRMLGLFIILPVIQVLGRDYPNASPTLLGLAMGIYGASQALLQIPFGWLSDRIGRKPVITMGLLLFIAGSLLAASAESISLVILGRALQGAGAISAAVMALLADLTADDNRSKAMASVGGAIGLSFAAALILGPALGEEAGLAAVFYLSTALGVVSLFILWIIVPAPPETIVSHSDISPKLDQFWTVLMDKNLIRLNVGIFSLHFVLMIIFSIVPLMLEESGWALASHWKIYLPTLGISFIAMIPLVIVAEKRGYIKQVFLGAIAAMLISFAIISRSFSSFALLVAGLFVFFFGFNLLEALLPSLVSKVAPAGRKGMALGIYSTCQFAGVFFGASIAGWLIGQEQYSAAALLALFALFVWLVVSLRLQIPANTKRVQLPFFLSGSDVDHRSEEIHSELLKLPGVRDIYVDRLAAQLYLKVDKEQFELAQAQKILAGTTG